MTGDEPPHETALEHRYRWLLAWYPWDHRRTYEEEMLGTLMAGAEPGQRWPAPVDAANLAIAAVRARIGRTVREGVDRAWLDAAAVFGLLAALLLLAWQVEPLIGRAVWAWSSTDHGSNPAIDGRQSPLLDDPIQWMQAGFWAMVLAATLIGLRSLAASLGWAAVLLDVVDLGNTYVLEPPRGVDGLWLVLFGIACAAALTVPASRRTGLTVLGRRRFLSIVACWAVLLVAAGWRGYQYRGIWSEPVIDRVAGISAPGALVGLVAIVGVVVVWGVPARVRRRGAVLLAPVVAVYLLVRLGLSTWSYSDWGEGQSGQLMPAQWALLAVVPLLTFTLGLALLCRREQTLRLAALPRDTDSDSTTGGPS